MAGIITIRLETENNISIKTIGITGKTIKMLYFLRTAYETVKSNYKKDQNYYAVYNIAKPGIYILISDENSIYIGQSDDVLERLNNHYSNDANKEYWVNTMIFMAEGNSPLNISQIKYLEAKLIEISKYAAEVEVNDANKTLKLRNKQMANVPNINVNDQIVADNFLEDILTLTKALGIQYFEDKEIKLRKLEEEKNLPIFFFRNSLVDAKMTISGDKYVLLNGSKIVKKEQPACKEYIKNRRRLLLSNNLLEELDKQYVVKEDISFDSASTAAGVVCGRSSNGRIEWKTADGKTLKELGL